MQKYIIFIDGTEERTRNYQIAICPRTLGGGNSSMTYRNYQTRNALEMDMRHYFGFADAEVKRFFEMPELHQKLVLPLSDRVAAHFGWTAPESLMVAKRS